MMIGRYAVIPSAVVAGASRFDPESGKQVVTLYYLLGDDVAELAQMTGKEEVAKSWMEKIDECIAIGDEARAELRGSDGDES